MNNLNFYDLSESVEDSGVVVRYKNFFVTAEFCTGPYGEYFTGSVYGTDCDLEEIDIFNADLILRSEMKDRFDSEGEALMAAFILIERGRCGEVLE